MITVARDELRDRIVQLGLPSDLERLICTSRPKEPTDIGTIYFTDPVGILHHAWLEEGLSSQLLPIGAGFNGDPVLLDFATETYPIGFLCDPELYGSKTIRDCFQPCYRTLASHMEAVERGSHTPFDYYEAREMLRLRGGENQYLCDPSRS